MLWIEPKRIIYMPAYVDREKINKRPYEIIVIGEKESEIPDLLLHSSDAYDIKEQFFRLFQINVEMRQQKKVLY